MYAKWEEADPGTEEPEDPNQGDVETDPDKDMIKLTIGERDAVVFGETKTNDVAPLIRSDRAFLPSRFIAESLGADVEWDNDNRKVTITKDETRIEITIDSDTAVVNGKEIKLDAAAFIENDRTYTPIRFISENLGAKVDWDPDTRDITITR